MFRIIGKSVPRVDGIPKATGTASYIGDYDFPGHWLGGTVRSGVPHGTLKGFIKDPSFDWSKVVFVTASDIPGGNFVRIVRDDYPALAEKRVTYVTEALALIAAPDEKTLKAALAAVTPDISPLPAALTLEEGLKAEIKVWGEDNILDEYHVERGDVEKGFAEADVIVEGTYETGLQEQMYMETQGAVAVPRPDGSVEIILSLQCPYYVHDAAVRALGLPKEKVIIRQPVTGGGFGGKEDYPSMMAVWSALLAVKSGRTVKMIYDRKEDLETTPKRHPSKTHQKMGFKKDGALVALEADLLLDGGACTTLTRVVLQRSTLHSAGVYKVPNVKIRGRAVATNTPPTGAFRGFGAPQAFFAVERNMDKAAALLGMDPLDLRLKNLMRDGDAFAHNQKMDEGVSAEAVLLRAAELSGYREKRAAFAARRNHERHGGLRRGIGLSIAMHGGGFTGSGEDNMGSVVRLAYRDGKFCVLCSSVDMGQGSATVLPMIAAETLGVELRHVRALPADTDVVPDSGPTVASRTTMFVGSTTRDACLNMIEKLRNFLAGENPPSSAEWKDGVYSVNGKTVTILEAAGAFSAKHGELSADGTYKGPRPGTPWDDDKFSGDAYKGYSWLATVVELEVDADTYEAAPVHTTAVAEIGRVIHPSMAEGQLAGGVLQGLGWAHIEDLSVTPEGRYSASHMNSYLVPTTLDAPEWTIETMGTPCAAGAFGAKGMGEMPCNGGAPAFLSAIDNALGVFPEKIPATGEYLFNLLERT